METLRSLPNVKDDEEGDSVSYINRHDKLGADIQLSDGLLNLCR